MILDKQHADAFREYAKPLAKLEKTLNRDKNGTVIIHAFADPFGNRMVRVTGGRGSQKVVCIEGAGPALAVRDVAKAAAV